MADSSASFKEGAAPVAPAAAPGNPGAPAGSSPAQAKTVTDILQLMAAPTKLSKEGEAYVATIVDEMTKKGCEPKVTSITGPNYEARVLEFNNYVTALVFTETYTPGTPPLPAAAVVQDLRGRFVSHGVTGTPAIFQVVTKEDYEKVDIMASMITNAYLCHGSPALRHFTAAALSNENYGLTDDLTVIRPFVERHCPTATLPRMDSAIMLYANKPVTNEFNLGNGGRPEFQQIPIVAVTGYTDFVYAEDQSLGGLGSGQVKYVPMYIITGIFSKIVDVSMATIGIALTSYLMISKNFWVKQFSSFKKDRPDIGNLLQDRDTGKPVQTKDIQQRNAVIANYLTTPYPYLAIDVQLGNFTIPGLGSLVASTVEVNQRVDQFTGCDGATRAGKATQLITHHFDGRIRMGGSKAGEFFDTRTVDYLSLIKAGYPSNDAASFLRAMQIPAYKSQELTKIYPDAEFMYITYRAFLNPQFVLNVSDDLGKTLKVRIDTQMDAGSYNIGALTGFQQAGIGNLGGFAMTSQVGGFSGAFGWGV